MLSRRRVPLQCRLRSSFLTSVGVCSLLLAVHEWQQHAPHDDRVSLRGASQGPAPDGASTAVHPRRLGTSKTDDSPQLYPEDLILSRPYREDPNRWLVFLHVIGIGYMLLGLNTVCDVYFTGALEEMVTEWNIKPDVAGATFMAAGGSAPEFFTSLIGTHVAMNDVGFSTIVGSAVFNVLFVIGLCGYVAKEAIDLTWWPLFRDCTYYIFGLSLLAFFASDQKVSFWEALILFCAYIVYCIIMYHNPRLEALVESKFGKERETLVESVTAEDATGDDKDRARRIGARAGDSSSDSDLREPASQSHDLGVLKTTEPQNITDLTKEEDEEEKEEREDRPTTPKDCPTICCPEHELEGKLTSDASVSTRDGVGTSEMGISSPASWTKWPAPVAPPDDNQDALRWAVPPIVDDDSRDDDDSDLMQKPEGLQDQIMWYFCLPIYVPLWYLTPQPTGDSLCPAVPVPKFLYAFVVSLLWIAGFSFLLVWWVEILGDICHVDEIVMGFTILAAGTSIPDAVSSMAVAKIGEGDMAVSSSIGSNIFDILVGLPVPWMIKTGIVDGLRKEIRLVSPYLAFYVILLLFMVFATVLSIHLLGWKLNRLLGLAMAGLYAVFLTIALTVEFTTPESLKF